MPEYPKLTAKEVAWGLKRLVKPLPRPANHRLLLKAFGFQKRTEQLFDAVGQRWCSHGSVQMIGGHRRMSKRCWPCD